MAYRNLQHFIEVLEKNNELIRIKEYVNPDLEISEITDRISKADSPLSEGEGQGVRSANKALLFENTGFDFPVLINSMGSKRRMELALGVNDLDDITKEIETLFKSLMSPKESILDKLAMLPKLGQIASWMPKVKKGKGECQEIILMNPDMTKLPVLTCWPQDGGRFITLPVVNTKDPITGIRNTGMYRMQVFEKDLTAMHWHKHKVSARHFNEYKKLGKKMPVAVVLGGDPAYTYAATAPLPDNVDEYMLAGFLRKKKVELVKCITQPEMEVPADADFVIEGYVDPAEDFIWEGPFGDHTGYYSLADWYPKFHITCITHRRGAVYPATIVGIPPQEDAWIGKATERIFLAPIKMTMVPEIVDMELPMEGVFHNLTIVKIKKDFAGQALKVMNAMWGAGQMMFNKILVVVDGDVNIHDYAAVAKYVSEHCNPSSDVYFSQGPMDVLDHSCSKMGFGGKMCIDGTRKFPEEILNDSITQLHNNSIENSFTIHHSLFTEIKSYNFELLKSEISVAIFGIEKNKLNHVKELTQRICALDEMKNVKTIIFVDANIDVSCIADVLWRACNNADARRDIFISSEKLIVDGTTKTKAFDNFDRDWPNILVHDDATIKAVDEKWNRLGLGEFIASPSLKYKSQMYGDGAVIK
jgi:4-hydroxy-3-polyprenylbenzoate decarboxylase